MIIEPTQYKDETPAQKIFMQLVPLAVTTLVDDMVSTRTTHSEKRKAAEVVLAYAFGKPAATDSKEHSTEVTLVIDDAMKDKIESALQRAHILMQQYQPLPETQVVMSDMKTLEKDLLSY